MFIIFVSLNLKLSLNKILTRGFSILGFQLVLILWPSIVKIRIFGQNFINHLCAVRDVSVLSSLLAYKCSFLFLLWQDHITRVRKALWKHYSWEWKLFWSVKKRKSQKMGVHLVSLGFRQTEERLRLYLLKKAGGAICSIYTKTAVFRPCRKQGKEA